MPVRVGQRCTAILCTITFDLWETTICIPSFNPRKWHTTRMLAREFKTSWIIRKSKNLEIKITGKFPNLQYLKKGISIWNVGKVEIFNVKTVNNTSFEKYIHFKISRIKVVNQGFRFFSRLMGRSDSWRKKWWDIFWNDGPKQIKLTTVDIWVVYFTYTLTQTPVCIYVYWLLIIQLNLS